MKLKLFISGAVASAALTLAACQNPKQQTPADDSTSACRADAANALGGKDRIGDADAKQMTGAAIVRQVRPGQAVTMDYRRERVTIETDPQTGKILRAYCG